MAYRTVRRGRSHGFLSLLGNRLQRRLQRPDLDALRPDGTQASRLVRLATRLLPTGSRAEEQLRQRAANLHALRLWTHDRRSAARFAGDSLGDTRRRGCDANHPAARMSFS